MDMNRMVQERRKDKYWVDLYKTENFCQDSLLPYSRCTNLKRGRKFV